MTDAKRCDSSEPAAPLRCTSTHCERAQECRSPNACTGDGKRLWPDRCRSEDATTTRDGEPRRRPTTEPIAPSTLSSRESAALEAATARAEAMRLIDELRRDEGHSVLLMCDNPDPNSQPNCAIEVCGDFTDWNERRFTGDTVLEALKAAVAARDASLAAQPAKAPADVAPPETPEVQQCPHCYVVGKTHRWWCPNKAEVPQAGSSAPADVAPAPAIPQCEAPAPLGTRSPHYCQRPRGHEGPHDFEPTAAPTPARQAGELATAAPMLVPRCPAHARQEAVAICVSDRVVRVRCARCGVLLWETPAPTSAAPDAVAEPREAGTLAEAKAMRCLTTYEPILEHGPLGIITPSMRAHPEGEWVGLADVAKALSSASLCFEHGGNACPDACGMCAALSASATPDAGAGEQHDFDHEGYCRKCLHHRSAESQCPGDYRAPAAAPTSAAPDAVALPLKLAQRALHCAAAMADDIRPSHDVWVAVRDGLLRHVPPQPGTRLAALSASATPDAGAGEDDEPDPISTYCEGCGATGLEPGASLIHEPNCPAKKPLPSRAGKDGGA